VSLGKTNYASILDAAVLEPETTAKEVEQLCNDAKKYGYACVAIMPHRVKQVAQLLKGTKIKISAAIGFPFGATTAATKAFETAEAIDNGANEIDFVMNIGRVKDGDFAAVKEDMAAVVKAAKAKGKDIIVKVILETCLLTEDEVIKACQIAEEAGMDFVKTSTGFNTDGANSEVLTLMKKTVGDRVQIKASGKVRTYEKAVEFTGCGCTRIGCSAKSAIAISTAALE
jgi:deoxyribose-phosphate aldolase